MEALDGDSSMQSNISSEREKENRKQAENKLYGDVTVFHDCYTAQNILLLTAAYRMSATPPIIFSMGHMP